MAHLGQTIYQADRARLQQLEGLLGQLVERVAVLEQENRRLRSGASTDVGRLTPPIDDGHATRDPLTRRRLLLGGAGAAAAGAVAVVGAASPASANGQGDPLLLGDPNNTATTATGVTAAFTDRAVFQAINTDSGGTANAMYARLGASSGLSRPAAVWGDSGATIGLAGTASSGVGVAGQATTGQGVAGTSGTGTAVSGYSLDGVGVSAYAKRGTTALTATATSPSGMSAPGTIVGDSSGAVGVVGLSTTKTGVYGISAGSSGFSGAGGVVGESSTAYGACGFSAQKAGVRAASNSSEGIRATSTTGVGGLFSGGRAAINLTPKGSAGKPTSGAHATGDLVVDKDGALYLCTASGTPGTWVKVTVTPA